MAYRPMGERRGLTRRERGQSVEAPTYVARLAGMAERIGSMGERRGLTCRERGQSVEAPTYVARLAAAWRSASARWASDAALRAASEARASRRPPGRR
ncbi:MAG: hypothetical protein IJI68_08175 [Eggerthellaceae bacterium]|nr:hypothetical protein [Eggerthellaceae bacterium]